MLHTKQSTPLHTTRRFLYTFPAAALVAVFLVNCTATKIEADGTLAPQPWEEARAETPAPPDEWEDLTVYESGEVGVTSDLYGEEVIAELGMPYEESVRFDPQLRYNVVYFEFNRSQIKTEGREVLRSHAEYLRSDPNAQVVLEGHTDERGSANYNLALGGRRALSVRNFLLAHQVPATQITWISYGEEKPATDGTTDAAYAQNRRVEILYGQ